MVSYTALQVNNSMRNSNEMHAHMRRSIKRGELLVLTTKRFDVFALYSVRLISLRWFYLVSILR